MKRENLPVREVVESERYVNFNGKQLQLLGYVFCELQVNDSYKKSQNPNSEERHEINYRQRMAIHAKLPSSPRTKCELEVNSFEKDQETSVETKQFVKDFPKLFERRGKITSHKVKINFKADAKITQQKGRRIPIQLQKVVD